MTRHPRFPGDFPSCSDSRPAAQKLLQPFCRSIACAEKLIVADVQQESTAIFAKIGQGRPRRCRPDRRRSLTQLFPVRRKLEPILPGLEPNAAGHQPTRLRTRPIWHHGHRHLAPFRSQSLVQIRGGWDLRPSPNKLFSPTHQTSIQKIGAMRVPAVRSRSEDDERRHAPCPPNRRSPQHSSVPSRIAASFRCNGDVIVRLWPCGHPAVSSGG